MLSRSFLRGAQLSTPARSDGTRPGSWPGGERASCQPPAVTEQGVLSTLDSRRRFSGFARGAHPRAPAPSPDSPWPWRGDHAGCGLPACHSGAPRSPERQRPDPQPAAPVVCRVFPLEAGAWTDTARRGLPHAANALPARGPHGPGFRGRHPSRELEIRAPVTFLLSVPVTKKAELAPASQPVLREGEAQSRFLAPEDAPPGASENRLSRVTRTRPAENRQDRKGGEDAVRLDLF